jgi:hypothetical protein
MFSNANMSRSILIYDMNRFFPIVFKQVSSSILFNFFNTTICFFGNKILAPPPSKTWKVQKVTSFCKELQISYGYVTDVLALFQQL